MQRDFQSVNALPAFLTFRGVPWKPSDFLELKRRGSSRADVPRILVDQRTVLWLRKHSIKN